MCLLIRSVSASPTPSYRWRPPTIADVFLDPGPFIALAPVSLGVLILRGQGWARRVAAELSGFLIPFSALFIVGAFVSLSYAPASFSIALIAEAVIALTAFAVTLMVCWRRSG
jgi:hypothetical protein